MNKSVLEKLLHSHNLFKYGEQGYEVFAQNFAPLPHVQVIKANTPQEERNINYNKLGEFLKVCSEGISQAHKFYIQHESDGLTNDELEKVGNDVKMMMPYENTFIQWNKKTMVEAIEPETYESKHMEKNLTYNLWCYERETGENETLTTCAVFIYDHDGGMFHSDYTFYDMHWDNETGDYTYWIHEKSPFKEFIDTDSDSNGVYMNRTLNMNVQLCSDIIFRLNLLLQFPTICDTDNRKGLAPTNRPTFLDPRKFKQSTMNAKPTWEHKVLKINMFENSTGLISSKNTSRSSGTKFHGVRKHLRKLPTGKHTFVKAHFRGAKEHGVITKDYEINN